jgi:hypothetical protein
MEPGEPLTEREFVDLGPEKRPMSLDEAMTIAMRWRESGMTAGERGRVREALLTEVLRLRRVQGLP